MKLPEYIEEEKKLVAKYLYPIMYEDKETNTRLVYANAFEDVKKDLPAGTIAILEKAMDRQKIAVVDPSLNMEEQKQFIKDFVNQNEEKCAIDYVESAELHMNEFYLSEAVKAVEKLTNQELKVLLEARLSAIRLKLDIEKAKENTPVDVSMDNILDYLVSIAKFEVNMAMDFDMPYIMQKLKVNDDITRTMVILDLIINNKTKLLVGNPDLLNDNVKNSRVMGTTLKKIASHYKNEVLGPIEVDSQIGPFVAATGQMVKGSFDYFSTNMEQIFKAASSVSDEERDDYIKSEIAEVIKEQQGGRK